MRRPNFLRFGSNIFFAEDSLIRGKYIIYGTNVCNFDWTFGDQIITYDTFEHLDGKSTDNMLEFYS